MMRNGDNLDWQVEDWQNSNIQVADTPNITVLEIRAMARRAKAAGKLDMILIDYLQLIHGGGRNESRQQEISDISRALKGIARELNVPVVALSQLSRAPEQRADRRPIAFGFEGFRSHRTGCGYGYIPVQGRIL